MKCELCGQTDFSVTDTRRIEIGIRRRRKCSHCGHAFTTYELPLKSYQKVTNLLNRSMDLLGQIGDIIAGYNLDEDEV